jgi:hypothetical protein
MQCEQLIRLTKSWFLHVKAETMAPARMMQFVDDHIKDCDVCREDLDLAEEVEKIRAFILPESKIPKAYRTQHNALTPEISPTVETAVDPAKNSQSVPTEDNQDR